MNYCEELLAIDGFEPVNAVTNVGFLLAAVWGWRAFRRAGIAGDRVPRTLTALSFAIGLGSFAWHATGKAWAQWADVLPILAFVLVFLAATLTRLCGVGTRGALTACAALVGTAVLAIVLFGKALNGSVAYVPVWFGLLGLTALLRHRAPRARPAFALASLLFALSLAFRTLDLELCAATGSHGTHWLWHVCNSLLLALLMNAFARHAPVRAAGRVDQATLPA